MQVLLLFAYCFISWSNSFVAAWLALATSLHLHPNTHFEVERPNGNDWKPSQTLAGTSYFFSHFSFLPSLPPSQTLYIPPAIMKSVSHLRAFPLLSLGGSGVCMGCDFCEFQVKPMLQLSWGQFCSILALSGHSWGWDHAAFLWL